MALNPYQKYQQQSVMTMTQGEMLTKLFDGIITQLNAAKMFHSEKDYEKSNQALQKAERIISHLQATLDFQYELSQNLYALYDYFNRRLIDANLHKENGPIDEVLPMISELREAFVQADRTARGG